MNETMPVGKELMDKYKALLTRNESLEAENATLSKVVKEKVEIIHSINRDNEDLGNSVQHLVEQLEVKEDLDPTQESNDSLEQRIKELESEKKVLFRAAGELKKERAELRQELAAVKFEARLSEPKLVILNEIDKYLASVMSLTHHPYGSFKAIPQSIQNIVHNHQHNVERANAVTKEHIELKEKYAYALDLLRGIMPGDLFNEV